MRLDKKRAKGKREKKKKPERGRVIIAHHRAFILAEQALGKLLSVDWCLP